MPALSAHGSNVSFDSNDIGGLTTIGLPDEEKEEMEITSHDSAGVREFVAGLRDSGTLTLGMRLIPGDTGQGALRTNYNAVGNTTVEVVITLPAQGADQLQITFDAYCSSLGGELPYDGAAERSAGLRISGTVTETLLSV